MTIGDTPWIKASASTNTGDCVEMRRFAGKIEIRDTKAGEQGPILIADSASVSTWLNSAKRGDFDHLIAGDLRRSRQQANEISTLAKIFATSPAVASSAKR